LPLGFRTAATRLGIVVLALAAGAPACSSSSGRKDQSSGTDAEADWVPADAGDDAVTAAEIDGGTPDASDD
jgi:hypothetical protein